MPTAFTPLIKGHKSSRPSFADQGAAFGHNLLRDNFTITTWLVLGAIMQMMLFAMPIRTIYTCSPAVLLLSWSLVDTALMTLGFKRNMYMHDVITTKCAGLFPGADGKFERPAAGNGKTPGGSGVVVFNVGFKSSHPFGMLTPGFKEINKYFLSMITDLQANAATDGCLGANFYVNAGQRTSGNEILTVWDLAAQKTCKSMLCHHYMDWYNKVVKKWPHLGFFHELYDVPAGSWENIYVNMQPALFGTTSHPIQRDDSSIGWVSPLVDARNGRVRTSAGRMGMDESID